ncbi:MAG: transglycosylase domain-containing protein [Deltaproteobacteria bacterium]|nr:transglycosylase domain-containing protein [Deltaproteobacteria bacterium]
MSTTTSPRFSPPPTDGAPVDAALAPPSRRRLKLALGALVALLACAALAVTLAVLVGRSKVEARLVAMGERFGLRIEVGSVDIPIIGSIGARDLRVFGRTGDLVAELERIETDLSLIDAALGASRPGRVDIQGGRLHARIADGRPLDLELVDRGEPTSPAGGPTDALTLALRDVKLVVEARHTTSSGPVELAPIIATLSEVEVSRDADRQIRAVARGTWRTRTADGERDVPVSAELDTRLGRLGLQVEGAAHLGAATPWGPVWVAIGALERERGGLTRVSGLHVVRGEDQIAVGAATLEGGGEGWLPEPRALTAASASGFSLRHGARTFAMDEARVTLGAEEGIAWPSPRLVTLRGARGEAPEPSTGGTIRGEADEVALGLSAPLARLAAGQPLEAIAEIKLVRPKATLVIPRVEANGTTAADAAPGEADAPPLTAMLGNDDELPADAAPKKATDSKAWSFLDRLFGDPADLHDPSLGDFVPAALRERVPELIARLATFKPEVRDASIEIADTAGKSLIALDGASFSAGPSSEHPGVVAIALRAAVLRDGKETGRADLEVAVDAAGVLQWVEGELAGKDLANRLARFVPHLTVQPDAELAIDIRYSRPRVDNAPHHIAGTIEVRNFNFEFWRISDREVRDLEGSATFDLSVDRRGRRLLLNLPELGMGQATMSGSLDLTKRAGKLPSFTARLQMARQDCGKVADSIPRSLIPNLSTLAMRGEMEFDASLVVDLENPRDLVLAVAGDIASCKIESLGPTIDLARLQGPFVHHPREPGRGVLEHIAVGPGTSQWVRAERLPEIVKLAAWVTEDRAWTKHAGVRWELVARALKIDLMHGRFVYGGSTITQQLVKNLYLTRTKNLARKLEEAIIAVQMERVLTKDEILTIYVNCIEYGPDIYGVKHAARHYFDKKVDELDALEAAFIMGLKPFPKAGYNQWLKGRLDEWWVKRVSHIMRLMPRFGPDIITEAEAEAFAESGFQPTFHRP